MINYETFAKERTRNKGGNSAPPWGRKTARWVEARAIYVWR